MQLLLRWFTMRAQMPEGGKQQPYGYSAAEANKLQNPATMNREPLVRVILTDTVNNKIASVGYLKFKITDKDTQDQQLRYSLHGSCNFSLYHRL